MTATRPSKTVDPREARIWAALQSETPIQQVTFDEANGSAHGLSNRSGWSPQEPTGGRTASDRHDPAEQIEVSKRKHYWLIAFFALLVAASVTLGSFLGLNAKNSPAQAPTNQTKAPTSRAATNPATERSPAPTLQPTFLSMDEFMSLLPAYSLDAAQANASSPQAKALRWLQNDSDYELYRLNQRYALGVLYYSTNIGKWSSSREWMSDTTECKWYADSHEEICDDSSHVSDLFLEENGDAYPQGSIPRELELLTHLKKLNFSEGLSCTFYSELYVFDRLVFDMRVAHLILPWLDCCDSGNLSRLKYLEIANLRGTIPTEM
jgi:hypothetical protein